MTYEEYRAARDAEEAEAEAKRKADREARRAAELAKTPEQRQAELEAMPFEERYAREKVAERLRKDGEELAASIAQLGLGQLAEDQARLEADIELSRPISRIEYRPLPFETGHIGLGKIETADLSAVNDAIASAEFEPRKLYRRLLWLAAAFASIGIMLLATYSSALGDRVADLEARIAALETPA